MSYRIKTPLKDIVGLNMPAPYCAFVIEYIKDWDHRRAAVVNGWDADEGIKIVKRNDVQQALRHLMDSRLKGALPDAEWVLRELVDNHFLARQKDQLAASNQALGMISKHRDVDAFAAEKVHVVGNEEIVARLHRGRMRTIPGEVIRDPVQPVEELSFF